MESTNFAYCFLVVISIDFHLEIIHILKKYYGDVAFKIPVWKECYNFFIQVIFLGC